MSKTKKFQLTENELLMFLMKVKTVLLLLITSSVQFQSMLHLNNVEFVPKGVADRLFMLALTTSRVGSNDQVVRFTSYKSDT